MNLEEKANKSGDGLAPNQKYIFKEGFVRGYNECKSELTEFIRANSKTTAEQILKHLEGKK